MSEQSSFESESKGTRSSVIGEFILMLKHNKKWWLLPILIALLLLGIIVVLGGTSLAPFIYTLF
jgi:fluoride ion exporter CrcB/FEX